MLLLAVSPRAMGARGGRDIGMRMGDLPVGCSGRHALTRTPLPSTPMAAINVTDTRSSAASIPDQGRRRGGGGDGEGWTAVGGHGLGQNRGGDVPAGRMNAARASPSQSS